MMMTNGRQREREREREKHATSAQPDTLTINRNRMTWRDTETTIDQFNQSTAHGGNFV